MTGESCIFACASYVIDFEAREKLLPRPCLGSYCCVALLVHPWTRTPAPVPPSATYRPCRGDNHSFRKHGRINPPMDLERLTTCAKTSCFAQPAPSSGASANRVVGYFHLLCALIHILSRE